MPEAEGIGRGGVRVRGPEGSGESELMPQAEGIDRGGVRVRGPEGSGESELASEALRGRARRCQRPRP